MDRINLNMKSRMSREIQVRFCERLWGQFLLPTRRISGAVENRPALNRLMDLIERGECEQLLTFSFSRIARSTSHLLKILQKCKDNKTRLVSITEQIDTNSPMGMALFTVLGALSQLERELIRERVRAGLAAAKLRGKQIGRKKLRNSTLIRSLLKSGVSFRKIAVIAKCSHGSISAEKKSMLLEEAEIQEKMALLPPGQSTSSGGNSEAPT